METCSSKEKKSISRKTIPVSVRNELIRRKQCANSPFNQAIGCKGYQCPMWKSNNGIFDESGFQIDHIVEVTHGGTNELENLQVLCPCCHSVKTKRCAKQNWNYTSDEIDFGVAKMESDRPSKRKRSNSV
jgi:5-methylcytosine-specific restriction endonuclease McrA